MPDRHRHHLLAKGLGEEGFSLIEIIAALVLLGVMVGGMGLGLSGMIRLFATSRDAVAVASKGQLAMLRLSREFRVISSVDSVVSSATTIKFTAKHGDVTNVTYTISKSGATITMNDGTNTDVLVDQVASMDLAYYDTFDGAPQTTWSGNRRLIELTITLNGPNGTTVPFVTRVAPRNL